MKYCTYTTYNPAFISQINDSQGSLGANNLIGMLIAFNLIFACCYLVIIFTWGYKRFFEKQYDYLKLSLFKYIRNFEALNGFFLIVNGVAFVVWLSWNITQWLNIVCP